MVTSMARTPTAERIGRGRAATAALWGASILLAALFASSALPKLTDGSLADFARWGYPPWFATAVGLMELVGAVAILVPRLALLGAAGMVAILVGALGTIGLNIASDAERLPVTAAALALALVVGAARRSAPLVGRGER